MVANVPTSPSAADPRYARYPSLEGRPVLITGGASGIGASLVEHFARQGARVAFIDVDRNAAAELVRSIGDSTPAPIYEICDLRDVEASVAIAEVLARKTGSFEVLINNAANDERHDALEATRDDWDSQMNVNLRPQFFLAQYFVRALPHTRRGSIVNLGSIAWMKGARNVSIYAAAKAGIAGMTKCLAREFGERRVRVNCIAPGWVMTAKQRERLAQVAPDAFDKAVALQSIAEPLEPADVARLALWLAADDSVHCTGQTLIVDGGVV